LLWQPRTHDPTSPPSDAARMSQSGLVTALRELLVAYLGNVKEARSVRQWADGIRSINNETDVERLRIAYRVARLIAERDSAAVAQTWFQGLNPILDRPTDQPTACAAAARG
jgi:hypothetical protein